MYQPRNIIDSKGASNSDTKYQIKIDGKGVDYKEVANNMNARILSIDFSNRAVVETYNFDTNSWIYFSEPILVILLL